MWTQGRQKKKKKRLFQSRQFAGWALSEADWTDHLEELANSLGMNAEGVNVRSDNN